LTVCFAREKFIFENCENLAQCSHQLKEKLNV